MRKRFLNIHAEDTFSLATFTQRSQSTFSGVNKRNFAELGINEMLI